MPVSVPGADLPAFRARLLGPERFASVVNPAQSALIGGPRDAQQPLHAAPRQARRQLPAADAADVPGARRRRLSRARRPSSTAASASPTPSSTRAPARLASALAQRGIGPGDTVSVMLANTPPMLEAHYGVPMTGAVLHSINTRLDAAIVAFQLDHAEAKVVICDREFAPVMREALAQREGRSRSSSTTTTGSSRRPASRCPALDYEAFLAERRSGVPLAHAGATSGTRSRSTTPRARPAIPRASSTTTAAPPDVLRQRARRRHGQASRSTCGRCRCSTATAGAFPGRCRSSPARTCACAGCAPRPCTRPSPSTRSRTCAARRS